MAITACEVQVYSPTSQAYSSQPPLVLFLERARGMHAKKQKIILPSRFSFERALGMHAKFNVNV